MNIDNIRKLFNDADGIFITAGAGMGVDAGIPDFRGASGLWSAEKDNFMKFSNGSAFHERPLEAWNFYINRLIKYSKLAPHRGYYNLLNIKKDLFVVTSNVDGHFERAEFDSEKILEIHGNLKYIQCSNHCCDDMQLMPDFTESLTDLSDLPHCPHCDTISRPVVMMFDDYNFVYKILAKQSERCSNWMKTKKSIVGIEIGAGLAVPSIRSFGERNTNMLIRINPHDYQISRKDDISIAATAIDGIDTILNLLG